MWVRRFFPKRAIVFWWMLGLTVLVLITILLKLLSLYEGLQVLLMFTLVLVTSEYAKSAAKQVEEMERQRLEAAHPSLSLRPENYMMDGSFSSVLLQNTGGLAKEVKIDIEMPDSLTKSLFVPAIDKEHVVYLPVEVQRIQRIGGILKVKMTLKDSRNRNSAEELSIDFSNLKQEGRNFGFQEAPIIRALENVENELRRIEGDLKDMERR